MNNKKRIDEAKERVKLSRRDCMYERGRFFPSGSRQRPAGSRGDGPAAADAGAHAALRAGRVPAAAPPAAPASAPLPARGEYPRHGTDTPTLQR